MHGRTLLAGAVLGSLAIAAPASGVTRTVTAHNAVARSCFKDVSPSPTGRKLIRANAPARGLVSVRLRSPGDWDLGVFGRRGRLVAGSASFGGNVLASGFVRRGERLVVQACRFRGDASSADVSIHFARIERTKARRFSLVDVPTPTRADRRRLQTLGLDVTEHGDADSVEVLLHGRGDARTLRATGFRYRVRIADLAAQARRSARRDAAHAHAAASGLPSGRTTYRRLPDYDLEMKNLTIQYPSLVRP